MKKQLMVAIVICAGLGIFYFASREKEVRVGMRELEIPKVDAKSVTKIVYAGKEKFTIIKKGDSFVIDVVEGTAHREFPASKEAMRELFEAIAGVKGGDFVTEQVSKHDEFHVAKASGQKVTLLVGDKPVWELIIGDYADEQGRYVRVPSQDAVFLAKARFWDITRSSVNDFRERQIVGLDESLVKTVRVEQGSKNLVVAKRDDQNAWLYDPDGMTVKTDSNANLVQSREFVKTVIELRATAFVDAQEQMIKARDLLDKSGERIVLGTNEKELVVTMAKDETEKKAYVQVKGSSDIFEISEYLYGRLHTSLLP